MANEKTITDQPASMKEKNQLNNSIVERTSTSAMRPHVNGESRNCKINPRSTATHLQIAPILTLQYISLLIAIALLVCLLSILLSGNLPQLPFSNAIATLDETTKAFIYFFGCGALCYVAVLLRKPVRALEFNKNTGVFWIEKQLIFGHKVGESAQMPIAQVCALQTLSYTNPRSINYKNNAAGREHEINVVFRSGERVNIVKHRNGGAIRQDASQLATFLEVPVWNTECIDNGDYLPLATAAAK